MPRLTITDEQAEKLDAQPEASEPLKLSRDRIGRLVLDEALNTRGKSSKKTKKATK